MKKLVVKDFLNWLNENSTTTVGMMGKHPDLFESPLSVYIRLNEVRRPVQMPTWAKQFENKCATYPMPTRTNGYDAKMNLCDIIGYQYAF